MPEIGSIIDGPLGLVRVRVLEVGHADWCDRDMAYVEYLDGQKPERGWCLVDHLGKEARPAAEQGVLL